MSGTVYGGMACLAPIMRNSIRIVPRVLVALMLGGLLCAAPVGAHGAAVGIHLHLVPDPASLGEIVTVSIRAVERMSQVEIAFAGHEAERKTVRLEKPARDLKVKIVVPEDVDTEVINIFVKAETLGGKVLLTSEILRISNPKPRENQEES